MKSTRNYATSRTWQFTLTVMAALLLAGIAFAAEQPPADMGLVSGTSRVMDFANVKRVAVSDPMVADYVVLSARQVMLTAKAPGATDLYVWDDKGEHRFRVSVAAAATSGETAARIRQAIGRPEIRVEEYNGIIVLEGEVDSPGEAERAGAIASAYAPKVSNLVRTRAAAPGPVLDVAAIQAAVGAGIKVSALTDRTLLFEGTATPEQKARLDALVRGLGSQIGIVDAVSAPAYEPRQILVHVKVVDIDRSALDEFGVTWGGLRFDGVKDGVLTETVQDQPITFGEVFTTPLGVGEGGPIKRLEGISARLQALITTSRARILAEPNLLVTEGKLADILVGGEIPIPVVQTATGASSGAAGAITVEWKEFGVKLQVQGRVIPGDQSIDLEVSPEVSSLDFGNAIVVSNIVLPALKTRKAHTMLHMGNGETLVIGGLYQTEWTKTVRRIPLLGDLPILGQLFRRTDKQQRNTELVILVTPEVLTEAISKARTDDAQKTIEAQP